MQFKLFNSRDTSLQTKMLIDCLIGLILTIMGIGGVVSYKLGGDIELLIASMTALAGGLGVLAAGAVRKDLYDYMTGKTNER